MVVKLDAEDLKGLVESVVEHAKKPAAMKLTVEGLRKIIREEAEAMMESDAEISRQTLAVLNGLKSGLVPNAEKLLKAGDRVVVSYAEESLVNDRTAPGKVEANPLRGYTPVKIPTGSPATVVGPAQSRFSGETKYYEIELEDGVHAVIPYTYLYAPGTEFPSSIWDEKGSSLAAK